MKQASWYLFDLSKEVVHTALARLSSAPGHSRRGLMPQVYAKAENLLIADLLELALHVRRLLEISDAKEAAMETEVALWIPELDARRLEKLKAHLNWESHNVWFALNTIIHSKMIHGYSVSGIAEDLDIDPIGRQVLLDLRVYDMTTDLGKRVVMHVPSLIKALLDRSALAKVWEREKEGKTVPPGTGSP